LKDKIVRFPVTSMKRKRNSMGDGYVPCMVSERWLQFPDMSAGDFKEGEFIDVSVMTLDSNEKPRKICSLVITREDIAKAVNAIKKPENG